MSDFLPYSRQSIDRDDIAAVTAVLQSDYLTTGPKVEEFEAAFARASGAEHVVACNSGTAALHLAVLAFDLGPGDAAIVPAMTFLATANVNRMAGAEVIFADVSAETGLLTSECLEAALGRTRKQGLRPAVILPVHLNGQVCDMAAIGKIAAQHGAHVIEDACHALGEVGIGSTRHARAACFSSHAVKAVATGEGGAVTTADAALAARMRRLRNHGMVREPNLLEDHQLSFDGSEPNPWSYEMPEIGWNYRMPDILCALGMSQLAKLSKSLARRREIAALYSKLLAPLSPVLRPVPCDGRPHGWHLYVLLIDFPALGASRARVVRELRAQGIGTQVHYTPVHRQPYYRRRYGEIVLPGADAYYARCLSIPFFPSMHDDDVHRVANALTSIVRGSA